MCYWWPKEDPKYDHSKSRAENYLMLRKLFENLVSSVDPNDKIKNSTASPEGYIKVALKDRRYKGSHLDWNYTEIVRDLIDLEIVKVPITDFEVIFVEWAAGNLDNSKRSDVRVTMALYDWDGGNIEDDFKPPAHRPKCMSLFSEKHSDAILAHQYTDSNREEYIPTPQLRQHLQQVQMVQPVQTPIQQPVTSESPANTVVEPQQYLNGADALQAMAQSQQQPVQVQYGGNQYIVPAQQQQQRKSWIPNVDYVDPNFIPEWERELMMKEAMMGAQGRALMRQMGLIPQYQPPQYQTVQPLPQQPPRFTSPEQVVNYILATQPEFFSDGITNDSINNALEGTFIGVDDQ